MNTWPTGEQSYAEAFEGRQREIVHLTEALKIANDENLRLRRGIEDLLDDAWTRLGGPVEEALKELLRGHS